MGEPAIDIQGLAKRFGAASVLDDLTLAVEPGQTFAFLGRNGAGKTTTIRMLIGLLKPDAGQIRVLGLNPARDALEIRRRVGFMAEDQTMFGWMRVSEIVSFISSFYPTWDDALARSYLQRFELPPKTRVRDLSKGQTARLALLLALAHRPELVILDDPTLGLDPIMRKEFIRDVIEHLQGSGVTVFFSSHLLYEIEPVADVVAILDRGRIVRQAATEQLRDEVKQLILPSAALESIGRLPGTLDVKPGGKRVAVVVERVAEALSALEQADVTPVIVDLNLDEIFEAYVIGRTDEQGPTQPALERVA
ncbi:MAG: ABC transporter ATP-binding protein [Phycisphaerae bacterium]|nr:ABC transporter ATP-binding protein [Phycisphaerae bacterium]